MNDIPIIAIIGRPNVGKSTLFNRLVGKRRAITDPTSGVTRDLLEENWVLNNHVVRLIDSGGIKVIREGLDDLVSKKSLSLLDISDAIIFLMDCKEVTSEDFTLMESLRPYSDKIILAVNKIDDFTREDLIWNYFSYGFQRVLGISSAHGIGIYELEDTLSGMLNLEDSDIEIEEENSIKVAVLGKPNTGKSTLTNLMTGNDISIVSDIPGTTRDVVKGGFTYKNSRYTILDTAGIRRKQKVGEDVEYYSVNRAIKTIDEADVVLLMIDASLGLVEQDKKIAQLIVRKGKGIILVLNKIDLLKGIANEFEAIQDRVRFFFPILSFAPIVGISAVTGEGIEDLLKEIQKVIKVLNKRVDTSTLNNSLANWSDAYEPPRGKHGHFKVYYGTQISAPPTRFLFFVNKLKDFPTTYESYLTNCIRRDLGFTNVPIAIELRERKRNESKNTLGPKLSKKRNDDTPPVERKFKKIVKPTSGRAKAKAKPKKPGAKQKFIAKASAKKVASRPPKNQRNK